MAARGLSMAPWGPGVGRLGFHPGPRGTSSLNARLPAAPSQVWRSVREPGAQHHGHVPKRSKLSTAMVKWGTHMTRGGRGGQDDRTEVKEEQEERKKKELEERMLPEETKEQI